MRALVTGGAGGGGNLVDGLARRHPDWEIAALDNLSRRGSEINLPRLEEAGVEFFEGDRRDGIPPAARRGQRQKANGAPRRRAGASAGAAGKRLTGRDGH